MNRSHSTHSTRRHPDNHNLRIYDGDTYQGLPLVPGNGPYIADYLERILQTIRQSRATHPYGIAFRVDLRLPVGFDWQQPSSRPLFSRFIDSLRAKKDSRIKRTVREHKRAYESAVQYIWAREFESEDHPHIHCLLFFNQKTFRGLGPLDPYGNNLYAMICQAWAQALGVDISVAARLVYIPENPVYPLKPGFPFDELFMRASYMAKARSKRFGYGMHSFGASRSGGSRNLLQAG